MDLALALGMTERQLSRSMTEREFRLWIRYVERKPLPARRLEFYLANLAFVVAKSVGAKNVKLEDFMLEFGTPKPQPAGKAVKALDFAGSLGGIGVHVLGKGRKKKG